MVSRTGRYQRVNPKSDGYKKGYRYIDYGAKSGSPIRFLKHKPRTTKRHR